MLKLPDVTLVLIETQEHSLARLAIDECLSKAEFGDILIMTDKEKEFQLFGPRFKIVPNWPDKLGWSRCLWYEVPPLIHTPFALCIQWDSFIWDVSKWRNDYFNYDYIGAPWWYSDGKNVGNGGFSLRSARLMRFVYTHQLQFPCHTPVDDDLLCRKYRPQLEGYGLTWAPESVAFDFAWEGCNQEYKNTIHFGIHAAFNFGLVLDHDKLLERARLMLESPYIAKPDSYILKNFCHKYPEIVKEAMEECEVKIVSDLT